MGLHIVLFRPEIPANTGNIARTCLATNTTLHLIHPLGFEITDKQLRRAGLDYWHQVKVKEYQDIEDLFSKYPLGIYYFVEDYGNQSYTEVNYRVFEREIFFIFGQESKGIPESLLKKNEEACIRIPMGPKVRSLNLSNSAAIVLYEALRQRNFPEMK